MSWLDIVSSLLDERAIIETSAIAVGTSVSALFYFLFRRTESRAKKVQSAVAFDIDDSLSNIVQDTPHSLLPYVALSGYVQPAERSLNCDANNTIKGVIWKKTTTEHKDVYQKYMQTWHNSTQEISSVSDSVPFNLEGKDRFVVRLVNPLDSAWIEDTIEVVHERFTPAPSNVMDNIVGYMSGDKLKGYTETEKMLRVGTKLCAIGELVFEDNVVKLRSPAGSSKDYIISKFTQHEIVLYIQKNAKIFKILALLFAAASATGIYFVIRRLLKRYKELKEVQKMHDDLNEIRQQRTTIAGRLNRDRLANEGQDPCVVCLTNPRECVLLDCGHICICVDCLEALPSPRECPVCRSPIVRTVPLYSV